MGGGLFSGFFLFGHLKCHFWYPQNGEEHICSMRLTLLLRYLHGKERSQSKNKNSSETSEAVGKTWQHAKIKILNLIKIRITLAPQAIFPKVPRAHLQSVSYRLSYNFNMPNCQQRMQEFTIFLESIILHHISKFVMG